MTAQEQTLDQYHQWMKINAVSHLIRAGRKVGIFTALEPGQRTAEQLCEQLSLQAEPTALLLDVLVAIGIIEQYGDDYALSQAARLLCQYDEDLGDQSWESVVDLVRGSRDRRQHDDQRHHDHNAATQWIQTGAAIEAAEILNLGGDDASSGLKILDVGCGSAVWSCAMAHRDPQATVTLVDFPSSIAAATQTAASIGISDRITAIQGDPDRVPLEESEYDLVLLAQRMHTLDDQISDRSLQRAVQAARSGGRVVVIDDFRGTSGPNLAEGMAAWKLQLATKSGRLRLLAEAQQQMQRCGLAEIQFSYLPASRTGLGMIVGEKP